MSTKSEFSKHAKDYDDNNIIQRIVSKALVRDIKNKPKNILELGCGSGQIFRHISWEIEHYKAIDFSASMCELHPRDKNIEVKCFDFDSEEFYTNIKDEKYDLVISASAMQWSKDLNLLIKRLLSVSKTINAVLFTSNTFKSIYDITKQAPAILSLEEIKEALTDTNSTFEVFNYKLEFQSKKELFKYIKNSGVKGEVQLSFKDAKNLYKKYDLNYLEFEVVFLEILVC
ncbi:MAG TPA: methyltransferase domain-containing protein [Arcobacter sp.]|nr:methyltransferase domain-containing protein [Arcobacter sp.]HIP55684.1 methyltransferase domain-containing protein [Arcobacter sp.]